MLGAEIRDFTVQLISMVICHQLWLEKGLLGTQLAAAIRALAPILHISGIHLPPLTSVTYNDFSSPKMRNHMAHMAHMAAKMAPKV